MFARKRLSTILLGVLLCLLVLKLGSSLPFQSCKKIDSCSCLLDNGDKIDLHSAAPKEVNSERVFYYQSPQMHDFFRYSPCTGLLCGGATENASLCMESSFLRRPATLGSLASVEFQVMDQNVTLLYTAEGMEPAVISRVVLQCSSQEQFVLDANTTIVFNFTLSSQCACPSIWRQYKTEIEISVGTVLTLIFCSAMTLYFGIGCLYRKAVHGGSCGEVVPHRDFWLSLPPLIKDGYMFFISPCLGNRAEYRTYDKL